MAGTDIKTLEALYASLSDSGRRRLMRGVVHEVRREQTQRIARQKDPDGNRFAPRSVDPNRPDQARGPMFKRIRLIRNMVVQATENSGSVGFAARMERIARVHQFGGKDRPRTGMRPVDYPERQLLGVSDQTDRVVLTAVEKHLLR